MLVSLLILGGCGIFPFNVGDFKALAIPNGNKAATDDDHHLHIVYALKDGSSNGIFYRRSQDWLDIEISAQGPTCPTASNNGCFEPAIAIEGSVVAVVWARRTNSQDYLDYTWSTDGGATFNSVHTITPGFAVDNPALAINNGKVHVVWRDGEYELRYAEFDHDDPLGPGHKVHEFPIEATSPCCNERFSTPSIAIANGDVFVGYIIDKEDCDSWQPTAEHSLGAHVVKKPASDTYWSDFYYSFGPSAVPCPSGTGPQPISTPYTTSLDATPDGDLWFAFSYLWGSGFIYAARIDTAASTVGTKLVAEPDTYSTVDISAHRDGSDEEVMIAWTDSAPGNPGFGPVFIWRGEWLDLPQSSGALGQLVHQNGRDPTLVQPTGISGQRGIQDNAWCRVNLIYVHQTPPPSDYRVGLYPPPPPAGVVCSAPRLN